MSLPHHSIRPNVLFVIVDDHQFDAIGCAGNPVVQTPVLDALARRGVHFTQATNMGGLMPAICSPSRACLLTGMTPFQASVDPRPGGGSADWVAIQPKLKTLPEIFRAADYDTFVTGKWHNDCEALLRSFNDGRQIFHGGMCEHTQVPVRDLAAIARNEPPRIGEGFSTELFCGATVDFIEQRDRSRPFFAWVALTSPHDPRTPPESFRRKYVPAEIPVPPAFAAEPAFDNGELDVRDEKLASKPLSPGIIQEHLADYYGMISHHDQEIGRIFDAIKQTGELDNTIVVYIGDHGLALGRHGLLGKQNLYEHSIRVPMILAGPGIGQNAKSAALVYSLDVFATLLELAGLPVPDGVESVSLVPQLAQPDLPGRAELVSIYKDCQRMVRDDRWKLIEYFVQGENRIELFDLTEPHEITDHSMDPACRDTVRQMRKRLGAWQERQGDQWMPVDLAVEPISARP